jgi:hypothetical protein
MTKECQNSKGAIRAKVEAEVKKILNLKLGLNYEIWSS